MMIFKVNILIKKNLKFIYSLGKDYNQYKKYKNFLVFGKSLEIVVKFYKNVCKIIIFYYNFVISKMF